MTDVLALKRFRIRTALPTDLRAVSLIEDDSFPSPYPPELFRKLLQEHGDSFFIAKEGSGKTVGYCLATRDGRFAHLISIAVLREHRRKGVAGALLQQLLKYLPRHGVDELWLEVNTGNKEAIGLYTKFGFLKIMILENYYSDGASAVRMRLGLNKDVQRVERKGR